MKLNLAGVKKIGERVPNGRYHVMLTDGDEDETGENSKKPGSPKWNVEFTIQDGAQAKRKLWDQCLLPPNYEPLTLNSILRASNEWTDEELDDPDFDVSIDELIEREIHLVVKVGTRKHDGESYATIKRYEPYDEDTWNDYLESQGEDSDDLP